MTSFPSVASRSPDAVASTGCKRHDHGDREGLPPTQCPRRLRCAPSPEQLADHRASGRSYGSLSSWPPSASYRALFELERSDVRIALEERCTVDFFVVWAVVRQDVEPVPNIDDVDEAVHDDWVAPHHDLVASR